MNLKLIGLLVVLFGSLNVGEPSINFTLACVLFAITDEIMKFALSIIHRHHSWIIRDIRTVNFIISFLLLYSTSRVMIEITRYSMHLDISFLFVMSVKLFFDGCIVAASIITMIHFYELVIGPKISNFVKETRTMIIAKFDDSMNMAIAIDPRLSHFIRRNPNNVPAAPICLGEEKLNAIAPLRCAGLENMPSDIDYVCAICRDEIDPRCLTRTLPCCKKTYHAKCINELLCRYSKQCPLCKDDLSCRSRAQTQVQA